MNGRKALVKLRDLILAATVFALLLALSGCVNPFDAGNRSGNGGNSQSPGTASVVITLDTVRASTVAPDIANLSAFVSSFEVVLTSTSYGTITVPGYTSGNPITDIPADGNWNVVVNGRNGGGDLVAVGEPTVPSANPIDLSGAAGSTVAVTVELQPQTSGADGSLTLNLDYSAAVTGDVSVDAINITLEEQAGGNTETVTASGPTGQVTEFFSNAGISDSAQVEVDFDARLMQISDADMPSGDYVITITFIEGGEDYAPIIRAIQVYDYLESNIDSGTGTGTITLAAGDLTSAPTTAPADMVVEFTGENAFNISWSDTTSTEAGYRVYDTTGTRTEVADVPSGTVTATGLTAASYSGPGTEEVQFEVVAYNRFGESPALVFDFRVLAAGGGPSMPTLLPGANANSTDWVPAAAPGEVGFGTLISGGEDSLEFYVDDTNDLSDITNLPAAEITETGIYSVPYDLSALTGLTANTTYNLRVGATKVNGGDTNRVYYPVEQFTVRDALHVSSGGISGAAGTPAAPVDTINEAVTLAVPAEIIRIESGIYTENIPLINTDLSMLGSFDPGFGTRTPTPTTILDSTQQYTLETDANVTIDRMEIQAGEAGIAYGIIEYFGGDLTIRDSLLFMEADAVQTGSTLIGLFVFDSNLAADTVTLDNTQVSVDETATNATNQINALRISSAFEGTVRLENGTEFQQVGTSGTPVFTNLNSFYWIFLFAGGTATMSLELDTVTIAEAWLADDVTSATVRNDRELMDFTVTNTTLDSVAINGTTERHTLEFRSGAQSFSISDSVIETAEGEGNSYAVRLEGPFATQPVIERSRITLGVPVTAGTSFGVYGEAPTGAVESFRLVNNVITNRGLGNQFWYGVFVADWTPQLYHNTLVSEHTGAARHVAVRADTADMNGIELGNNLLVGNGTPTHIAVEEIVTGNSYFYAEFSGNGFFGTNDTTQTDIESYNTLGGVGANFAAVADPSLDASYRPQTGTTPYRVRSGGIDVTGTIPTDFDGIGRTAGTGVTVGAFELDDNRTLRTLIFNGTIDGVGAGLFQGDVVDDGSTITMNPTLITTLADPLNDARAMDYTVGATDEIHYVDGTDIWVVDLSGAGPPFIPTLRGDLTATWPNGLALGAPNVQDIHLLFDTGNLIYEYFVADINEGIYYVDVSTNTIVDLMSYAGIDGTAVVSDTTPTNMWFANSLTEEFARASATVNTPLGNEDVMEQVAVGEVINDISFDFVDRFWLAVQTTNQADGYIAIDTDASGPGDRQVIIPESETNGEPESIYYDVGLDVIFWTEIGAFYDTDIRMAFEDGHTIGGGYPTLITGGGGAGQLTDGGKLAVKP